MNPFVFTALLLAPLPALQAADMSKYNVIWNSPSKDATGVMPIGNGDIAAGVYAIANGDLYLLLAKNDAYNYMGDIFKTGRVRVSLDPNPFKTGRAFRQTLDLPTGSIRIEADGVTLRIWADVNHPVYHLGNQTACCSRMKTIVLGAAGSRSETSGCSTGRCWPAATAI